MGIMTCVLNGCVEREVNRPDALEDKIGAVTLSIRVNVNS